MAPSSTSTNCIRAFRGGPAWYRRRRAEGKARRGHHTPRPDLALAWGVSTYRGANAFNHASGSHSMARVVRRHHLGLPNFEQALRSIRVDLGH